MTELQEGDYVLFWSKHNPEMQFLGTMIIDEWGTEYRIKPDSGILYSYQNLRELIRSFGAFSLNNSSYAAIGISISEELILEKIEEKEYFYRKLRGAQ